MISRNLVLTMLAGGTILGLASQAIVPTAMKPPPEQPWRHMLESKPAAGTAGYEFVEAGPTDLSPRREPLPWQLSDQSIAAYYAEPAIPDFAIPAAPEYDPGALPEPVGAEVAYYPDPAPLPPEPSDHAHAAASAAQDAARDVSQALRLPNGRAALAGL
jgi:hypothetical protein